VSAPGHKSAPLRCCFEWLSPQVGDAVKMTQEAHFDLARRMGHLGMRLRCQRGSGAFLGRADARASARGKRSLETTKLGPGPVQQAGA